MNTASRPTVRHTHRAFTLIELLTVIAIIGILAAIIIPTVGRVRESARSAQCVSNLRQITMALMVYADDNKGFLPASSRPLLQSETGTGSAVIWTKALRSYLPLLGNTATAREHPIFVCGSAEINGRRGTELANTYTATAALLGLNTSGVPNQSALPRAVSSIDRNRTSQIPLIMEGKASNATSSTTNPSRIWSRASADMNVAGYQDTVDFDFRHGGRMNVSYVDGSVRSMDFASFKTIDQATYLGLPNL